MTRTDVDQIEITPEMIEAGRYVLSEFDPEFADRDAFIRQIFEKMLAARDPTAEDR